MISSFTFYWSREANICAALFANYLWNFCLDKLFITPLFCTAQILSCIFPSRFFLNTLKVFGVFSVSAFALSFYQPDTL